MSDWMPIETAPTDGTDVLLSDGVMVSMGFYRDLRHRFVRNVWHVMSTNAGYISDPTHWMPLPHPTRK